MKKTFYNLVMFPYPSAEGLHVGHIVPYSGADTFGRFMKMKGFDVFEPMGFDAFGIHAENFAIKKGVHPKELIAQTITYFREKQMKRLGTLFNWDYSVDTTDPKYYKWTQWLFIQMFRRGLAYKKKSAVTYCPSCKTVLADEQTETKNNQTVCERCKTPIERKETEQWFFKITEYADRLLNNLPKLNWSEKTKIAQKNWIGRKEGSLVKFEIFNLKFKINVFTTRVDTIYGATYLVLAPQHEAVSEILKVVDEKKRREIEDYAAEKKTKTEQELLTQLKEKSGVDTGLTAENPFSHEQIPIWIADYVLTDYGTGAVMGVPAHDERDFAFAKKYKLPVKEVCTDFGKLINSGEYTGLSAKEARQKINSYLQKNNLGGTRITYKLRDWCVSRQRYWGPPIPMIHCEKCGWLPVPESELPVLLPDIKDYLPDGSGKSPLAKVPEFYLTKCPKCGGDAERETDVSDTFLDSAWYFLRYPFAHNDKQPFPFKNDALAKWLPVDMYIGGNEHACLHLMYSRFVNMVLYDMGLLKEEEPFKRFFAHGLLIKEGAKMSKSRGNVINPIEYIDKYGSDTMRMYILFLGPYGDSFDFRDSGITGIKRFLERVRGWTINSYNSYNSYKNYKKDMDQTIKKITRDLEELKFNTAIAALMKLLNNLTKNKTGKETKKTFLKLLAPFAPFMTEELWEKMGEKGSVHDQKWPTPEYGIQNTEYGNKATIIIQINGKTRGKMGIESPPAGGEAGREGREEIEGEAKKIAAKYLTGKKIKKTIYVPEKIINFVI